MSSVPSVKRTGSTGLRRKKSFLARVVQDWQLIVICLPAVIALAIFSYTPMFGVLYGFQDVSLRGSFWENEWVGLKWFQDFLRGFYIKRLIRNTLSLNIWGLIGGMTANIGLALLFSETKDGIFKRVTQSLTFFPNFLSTAIVVYMLMNMFSPGRGILSITVMKWLGYDNVDVFSRASLFQPIYILSGIWQGAGWGSIIYLGAINGIDATLYEAAAIDGAGRLQRVWHITLPGMKQVTVTLLILSIGGMMSHGSGKIILMYSPETYETADVISTYVYREGLGGGEFGFATAVGLFQTIINLILLLIANAASKRLSEVSIF